ncbi:copper resistance CopC family protein [Nocardioides sp. GY 10113]|uniref:copper resistance CopC family protein n=1 Tax=Nocardioides sp. GY 10113 TaxID=2569761 RepID=UPI00145855D8|nr:copper resistance CopC family protein [Nocardioides sp. GY 10113]
MKKTPRHAGWAATLVALVASALFGVVAAGWSNPAAAHTSLVGSTPEDGARLDALPAEMTFTFSEPISPPAYVVVTAPDGTPAAAEEVRVAGTEVSVALADPGIAGRYTAAFRVVSEDGHPVTGQLSFDVGDAAASDEPSDEPSGATSDEPADEPADEPVTDAAIGVEVDPGPSRSTIFWGVGIGLFAVAGGLALLARRSRS